MDYRNIVISTLELEKSKYLDNLIYQLNQSFTKNFNHEELLFKYKDNHKGYSIHSLLIFQEKIVAAFTCMPRMLGKISILVGCDTFVIEQHRKKILILKNLYYSLIKSELNNNYSMILGVPNEKASLYWDKIAKWKIKSELDIVIFPVIGGYFKYFFGFFYFIITLLFFKRYKNIITQDISHLKKFKNYDRLENTYSKNYLESEKRFTYIFDFSDISRFELANNIYKSIISNGNNIILIGYKNPLRKLRANKIISRKLNIHVEYFDDLYLEKFSFDLAILDNR